MRTQTPCSLDSTKLARRLGELVGEERQVQVGFLLHLDEFDRRRAFLELGYGSLWDYCLKALHLREGAAGRRIGAMRVLRRFPKIEGALRDGRLCLSTLALLGQVLTEENADELVARAAYLTKAEVDHLVASLQPRRAPKDGIRKVPEPSGTAKEMSTSPPEAPADHPPAELPSSLAPAAPQPAPVTGPRDAGSFTLALAPAAAQSATRGEPPPAASPAPEVFEAPRPRAAEVRAVSEDLWSLRATIDSTCKKDLETLAMLLSHKLPGANLAAVLHEAIRCGLEKHGKRKGAVEPAERLEPKRERNDSVPMQRASAVASVKASSAISADVRRQVWNRDGASCTWRGPDGRRCGSRWQLEVDHVRPPSLGGTSTPDNLRLLCKPHNMLHAEEVYGRRGFMEQFRRDGPAIAGAEDPTHLARWILL